MFSFCTFLRINDPFACVALAGVYDVFFLALLILFISNALFYLIYIPSVTHFISNAPKKQLVDVFLNIAKGLSLLRLPFGVIPYFLKLITFLLLPRVFWKVWNARIIQGFRLLGDFFNLGISFMILYFCLPSWMFPFLLLMSWAEICRLVCEKGFILFSMFWQRVCVPVIAGLLPRLRLRNEWALYYRQAIEDKLDYFQNIFLAQAQADARFYYFSHLHAVANDHNLRLGNVREIASGRIFIYQEWANDPWLCAGLALRRAPWIFDPRYLPRPFFYRSQANKLMTGFVFLYAKVSPPFALYQFGHEIKSARFEIFFRLFRWMGLELERFVQKDGVYDFDPLLLKLGGILGINEIPKDRPIFTDADSIADVFRKIKRGDVITPRSVAEEYAYPLLYVDQVLWSEIERASSEKS